MSRWQAWELGLVVELYPHVPTFLLAAELKRTTGQVYQKAAKLGLVKTPRYLASKWAQRLRRDNPNSIANRFKKGQAPANKGLRRPGWAPGRMAQTQFKKGERKGQAALNYRPIGSELIDVDGYTLRKVSETGCRRVDWPALHVLTWTQHNGPVPNGHAVVFRDGNKRNTAIENLELVSRAELMRRNTVHRLPKEVALAVQMLGALKRQIHNRERVNEKQD